MPSEFISGTALSTFAGVAAGRVRVIDLSVTLSEDLPGTWPGHMRYAHGPWSWFAERPLPSGQSSRSLGPYHTNFVIIDEHCGTHVDAPAHFVPPDGSGLPWAGPLGAITGDRISLSQLIGPAAVIDLRDLAGASQPGISPVISAAHLQVWEDAYGALRDGEIVLLWTGWSRHYVPGPTGGAFVDGPLAGASPGWPALEAEAAIWLHERGVRTVGIDAPSIGAAHDGAPAHWHGLSRGMAFVEMLTNLDALPVRGATFVFLGLKIAASSGCPGRAVALLAGGEQDE